MTIYAKGMKPGALRARIGQTYEGECHLTAEEAELLFAVYEAACEARDAACVQDLWDETRATLRARIYDAVDAARKAGT